jgi:hypothetical protein
MRTADPTSSSPRAKYNVIRNNCHTFTLGLLHAAISSDVGEYNSPNSRALAGLNKMAAVSSDHGITELYHSPIAWGRAVKDMWTGQLRKKHFEGLLPDYERGAVMEEKYRQRGLIY